MVVSTIPLKHDCIENVAYKLNDGILQSAYMVDFGEWSESEIEFCNEADRIIIESYYDETKPIKNLHWNCEEEAPTDIFPFRLQMSLSKS